jgi:hypothetical protein
VDINDMVLVSVDDHVVEPPDLFKDRLPKKYVDLAPQFLTKEDGTNVWSYGAPRSATSLSTPWRVVQRTSTALSRPPSAIYGPAATT